MLRKTLIRWHNRRDIAENAHNFAFDLSTKIYREAVPQGKGAVKIQPASPPSVGTKQSGDGGGGSSKLPRMSGLQLEILGLYRSCVKAANRLEDPKSKMNLRRFIRAEFDKQRSIPRRMVTKIEWQMHYGRTKLEDLKAMKPNTKFNVVT